MKKKLLITIVGVILIIVLSTVVTIVVANPNPSYLGQLNGIVLDENEDYGMCTGVGEFNPDNPEDLSDEMKELIGVPITLYELGTANTISIKLEDKFSYTGDISIIVVAKDHVDKTLGLITHKIEKSGEYLAKIIDISSLSNINAIHHYDVYAWDSEHNIVPVTINCNVVNNL